MNYPLPPDRAASPANTVLVVGASGALGQSICERLADDGYDLLLTYHSKREAVQALEQQLASRVAVSSIALDLTDEASVAAVRRHVEAAGISLHGLVFASGTRIEQPWVVDIEMAQWREVLAIEVLGFATLAHYFIPLFRQQGGGVFVCISTFANFTYQVGDALSSVPKAGVESMVRSIALEEGRYGIRANCVAPGIINAGLGAEFQQKLHAPETWEAIRKKVPMRRFGEASEVAQAVRFLVSRESSYITGNTLVIDGGMHL